MSRADLAQFTSLFRAVWGYNPVWKGETLDMKIERIELFQVPPRWLFLKLTTDDGLSGWGEPVIEGRAATAAAAVQEMEEYLIGQDPRRIEDLWQTLYRGGFYRGGPILMSAIAGID